jgi:hypothetical protein
MRIPVPITYKDFRPNEGKNTKYSANPDLGFWIVSISFKNNGSDDVKVNGMLIKSGDPMVTFAGDTPSIDTTIYEMIFQGNTGPACDVIITYGKGFKMIEINDPIVVPVK